jgi:flagellin
VTTDKSGTAQVTVGTVQDTVDVGGTPTQVTNQGLENLGFANAATASGTAEGRNTDASVEKIDITTTAGAQSAIATIDAALKEVDITRASLGAIQNRFESTISNLQSVSENASAARGRIMDTDFAAETAALTKNQILQQAGTSILAQANQLPQAVLSLLG